MSRKALVVAAVVMSFVVAACGSDGSGNTVNDQTSEYKDTSDPDLAPVKVGMILPIGTPNSDLPDLVAALKAAVLGVNARGGLNGHRLEAVICNDKDDPNEGSRCARQMVEEKVAAMVGMAGGAVTGSKITPILADAGIPVVGAESADPVMWNSKNAYFIAQPSPFNYEALIAYAVKNDLLPMAVAAADNPAGLQYSDFLEETLKKLSGGEGFSDVVPVADTTSDYAPIAGALLGGKPKSVLNIIGLQQIIGVGRAINAAGDEVVMLSGSPAGVKDLADAGPFAGYLVNAGPYPPASNPSLAEFRKEMAAEEATGDENASLEEAGFYAPYPWIAVQALAKVTEGLDTIDAGTLTKALDEAKGVDLGGIAPPWTPSDPGPEGFSRVSNAASWFIAFEDGQFVSLTEAPIAQADIAALTFEADLPPSAR